MLVVRSKEEGIIHVVAVNLASQPVSLLHMHKLSPIQRPSLPGVTHLATY